MKLTQHSYSIWTIEDFLSEEECNSLILFSDEKGYVEDKVSTPDGPILMKGLRSNSRLVIQDPILAEKFWQKLKPFCPATIDGWDSCGLNEQFRFYKYKSAERFDPQIDESFKRNDMEESRITFMIYLNQNFEGGETAFDDITIVPKTGTALCFIHELKHEGCPVTSGTKYALRSDVMYRKG